MFRERCRSQPPEAAIAAFAMLVAPLELFSFTSEGTCLRV
jgi:hypothetical protein